MQAAEYKKTYRKQFTAGYLTETSNEIASSVLIIAYAIFLGLEAFHVGIFLSLKIMFNIFNIFSASFFTRFGQSKALVLTMYAISRASLFLVVIVPLVTDDITIRFILFTAFISLRWLIGIFLYPALVAWKMLLIREPDRKRYFAQFNFAVQLTSVVIIFLYGVFLDQFAGMGDTYWVFFSLFAVIFALNVAVICIRITMQKPAPVDSANLSVKQTLCIPLSNPTSRRTIFQSAIVHLSINLATIYLGAYKILVLELSYTYTVALAVMFTLAMIAGGFVWERVATRYGYTPTIAISLVLLMATFVGLAFVSNIWVLPVLFAVHGFGRAGVGLFKSVAIYENAPPQHKVATISVNRFFHGLGGIIIFLVPILFMRSGDNHFVIRALFIVGAIGLLISLIYTVVPSLFKKQVVAPKQPVQFES